MELQRIVETRTNNFSDPQMGEKFQQLWNHALTIIPKNEVAYAVYSDYESDYLGDYTIGIYRIGQEADIKIDENVQYEVFNVDSTDDQGVFRMWQRIWEQEELGRLRRAYTKDFERYTADGEVTIHLSII